ncbi:MAG TPA: heme o synthase [Ardenticatenaceae bacterium]|nr:heme o synthase [Ardenticatenaceae bacterium]
MTLVRQSAIATAIATYVLVVVGGLAHIASAGLLCAGWPLCASSPIATLREPALLEYAYRATTAATALLIGLTALAVWRARPADRLVRVMTVALVVLLALQIAASGPAVSFELPRATALAFFGAALVLATATLYPAPLAPSRLGGRAQRQARRYRQLVLAAALAGQVLLITGDGVVGTRSQTACVASLLGCVGNLFGGALGSAAPQHFIHRAGTIAVALLLAAAIWWTFRHHRTQRALVLAAALSGILFLAAVGAGAAYLLPDVPAGLAGLHLVVATLVSASLIVFSVLAFRAPLTEPGSVRHAEHSSAAVAAGLRPAPAMARRSVIGEQLASSVALTKPRVISLLLVTMLGAMMVAAGGLPSPALLLWATIGGYLAAGGANAINMYFDHDIDAIMTRTRKRPVPSRRLAREQALLFGLLLGTLSFAVFALFVNVLSGLLALAGLAFYVLIYTLWLKRSSPQNIVIGGAAGAFPPLVGWAAVTGSLSLVPIWLFLIIFYWTPPHFWALALMRRSDYANAGVPMLPVVHGEAETRRQIALYSLLMIALTLVLVPFGMMGLLYFVAALVLGVIWMLYVHRIWRAATPDAPWGLYKYSLLYLALLFVAMVIDRALA